jgi:hypothetical protein
MKRLDNAEIIKKYDKKNYCHNIIHMPQNIFWGYDKCKINLTDTFEAKKYERVVIFSSANDLISAKLIKEAFHKIAKISVFTIDTKVFYDRMIEEVATQNRLPARLLKAIVAVESNYNPLAIGVNNKKASYSLFPKTKQEARILIRKLERQGRNFDVGLAQINIRNIKRMGVSFDLILNPEMNVALGARILKSLIKRYGLTWEAVWHYNGNKQYAFKIYEALMSQKISLESRVKPFLEFPHFLEVSEEELDIRFCFMFFRNQRFFTDSLKDSLYSIGKGIVSEVRNSKYPFGCMNGMQCKNV